MVTEITIPVSDRQGTLITPNKKISSVLSKQKVKCSVQIPMPDREDESKSLTFSIEQSTDRAAVWFRKAGFTWVGNVPPPPPPGVEKPYQDPGIIFNLSESRGYWIRAVIEIPVTLQCGLTVETV